MWGRKGGSLSETRKLTLSLRKLVPAEKRQVISSDILSGMCGGLKSTTEIRRYLHKFQQLGNLAKPTAGRKHASLTTTFRDPPPPGGCVGQCLRKLFIIAFDFFL